MSEDTRKTKALLRYFNLENNILSLQKYNEKQRLAQIERLLKKGQKIAIVSDAGTPNVSDPGAFVIRNLIDKCYSITPIPGPSAVTCLASISGMLCNQFIFGGFFPKKKQHATTMLESAEKLEIPLIFFETAKRLLGTLSYLNKHYHITDICIGKELTKTYETLHVASTINDIQTALPETIKGEYCIAVKLKQNKNEKLEKMIQELQKLHLNGKQIKGLAALLDIPKNNTYKRLMGAPS